MAQSNATVAEYMRNIEASPWLGTTDLIKTENKHGDSRTPYEFELVVHLDQPQDRCESGAPASASSRRIRLTAGAPAIGRKSLRRPRYFGCAAANLRRSVERKGGAAQ